jgi:hypothetical protein
MVQLPNFANFANPDSRFPGLLVRKILNLRSHPAAIHTPRGALPASCMQAASSSRNIAGICTNSHMGGKINNNNNKTKT